MNVNAAIGDLIVLVADKSMSQAIAGLLRRSQALGVRGIDYRISVHQQHDAGCRLDAAAFLRPLASRFEHALVLFDREGCGSEAPREEIEGQVEDELRRNGWGCRARTVVIDPELEIWIRAPSARLAQELGWGTSFRELRNWLAAKGLWPTDVPKPPDPKAAMVEAMRARRRPKSAATFGRLGREMSFRGCQDSAFEKLRGTLMEWFPLYLALSLAQSRSGTPVISRSPQFGRRRSRPAAPKPAVASVRLPAVGAGLSRRPVLPVPWPRLESRCRPSKQGSRQAP